MGVEFIGEFGFLEDGPVDVHFVEAAAGLLEAAVPAVADVVEGKVGAAGGLLGFLVGIAALELGLAGSR